MPSRYYFLSSLPMLRFQDHAPMTWERFLSEAKGNVSDADYALLCSLPERKDGSNAFLRRWNELNGNLENAINVQRRLKLGRPVDSGVVLSEYDIEHTANAAMNAKNPLEAEMLIMRFQYDYLETEKGFDPFTEGALFAYALQLRILIRKDHFTVEEDNKEYDKLFGAIQNELKME